MFDKQNMGLRQSFLFYNWHFYSTVSVGWYTSMMAVCGLVVLKIVGKPIPCCLYLSIITYPNTYTQPLTHPCIHQNTHTRTHTDDQHDHFSTHTHTQTQKHTHIRTTIHTQTKTLTHTPANQNTHRKLLNTQVSLIYYVQYSKHNYCA